MRRNHSFNRKQWACHRLGSNFIMSQAVAYPIVPVNSDVMRLTRELGTSCENI